MSKKYILLTSFIYTIGGGQIYCNNKSLFCQENGFDTYVFSTKKGKIEIQNLKKYADLICEDLLLSPFCLPKNKMESILDWMCKITDFKVGDEVIIESHTPHLAMWGEILAKRINAKHFVYLLGERFEGETSFVKSFLKFKHERKELACISENAMQKLFKNCETCYSLKPALGNPVEDIEIPDEYVQKCEGKTVVGIIGRGRKAYVFESVKKVCDFATTHNDKNFLILHVGGAKKSIRKTLKKHVSNYSNVELVCTGEMFPIPRDLLKLMHVCIAGAGCVKPPHIEDIPTISLDVYDSEAIGVYGYDTFCKLERTEPMKESVLEYLEEILFGDFLDKHEFEKEQATDFRECYATHFEFLKNSADTKEYYQFKNIKLSKKDKLFSLIYILGGAKCVKQLKNARLKK